MDIKYFIKLYTRQHELIDELYVLSNISFSKTLNGIGSCTFNSPIKYLSEKEIELILNQHIELYKIENNKEELLWFGVVNSPCPVNEDIQCICLGYACLFQNRNFIDIGLNSKNEFKRDYHNKTYGSLIFSLISEINNITRTGIELGECEDSTLKTDRVIEWSDDLYEKIQEFIEASNCYFQITEERKFNFYKNLGEDKSEYYEINDYNIIGSLDYIIDQTQIANVVSARVSWEEDKVFNALMSTAIDYNSLNLYGRREKVIQVNDIRLQETLDKQCEEVLNAYKDPLINCTVKVGISEVFNIFDIGVGDYIKLNTEKYKLNIKIKVLEYKVDLTENTVTITLGNSIFRDNKPTIYRYK